MYRTILVPVDGSPLAERALFAAEKLARASHARLLLLHVAAGATDAGDSTLASERRAIQTYLERLAVRFRSEVAVEVILAVGDPATGILSEVGVRQVDLVVMSTHGRSGLGRWIYGSVADQVMRQIAVPLLLVPAGCPLSWPADRALRILVPLDSSPFAEEALGPASELADVLGAELRLVRVVEPRSALASDPAGYLAFDPTLELAAARAYLEAIAANLRARGNSVAVIDAFGFAVTAIVDTAREQSADVIVMSTHGSGGLTRLILGSVATGVIQRASVPVLAVRPTAALASPAPTVQVGEAVS